jgi:hypothetical protein
MFDSGPESFGSGSELASSAPTLRPWYASRPARSSRVTLRCDCGQQCALRALAAAGPLLWMGSHDGSLDVVPGRSWLDGGAYMLEAAIDSDAVLECLSWRIASGATVAAHALACTDWRSLDRLAAAGRPTGIDGQAQRMRWALVASIDIRGELHPVAARALSGLDLDLVEAWLRHRGLDPSRALAGSGRRVPLIR